VNDEWSLMTSHQHPRPARVHPVLAEVTRTVTERSRPAREAYLRRIDEAAATGPMRSKLACANLAHGFAASAPAEKRELAAFVKPNVAIVTSYNDMLSAHQPFETYPAQVRSAVLGAGGLAQVAGGVPAMCDGITQGRDGMQLSLFSRDLIAMSTAVALSHDMFDGAVMLGVCDKIVPGLVIGALSFGHLPTILVPAGPMGSGLPNGEKARVRQAYAAGQVGREELIAAESAAYHSAGTCTFYGTANSNQLLMEVMGLHLPGASFAPPQGALREALTAEASRRVLGLTALSDGYLPIGRMLDERSFVNAVVALLATGGSTNHTLHLVAMAAAAGIDLRWEDFDALSAVVPLLARIYPNGPADVNHFHAAGGIGFLVAELLDAGLLHEDVATVMGSGLAAYRTQAFLDPADPLRVTWRPVGSTSGDPEVLRPVADPFSPDGGLRMLDGNLGRAVAKVSAVAPQHQAVQAPVRVFEDQWDLVTAFEAGELDRDLVAVVRGQGPRANGMPELHKLVPCLGVLQDRGHRVALVTDGRMSGASGKVLVAMHVTPESADDGPLARLRDGDVVRVDATTGTLAVALPAAELAARAPVRPRPAAAGTGRELFDLFRRGVGPASAGASVLGHHRPPTVGAPTVGAHS
jgi:phosphogluconate dehydratase